MSVAEATTTGAIVYPESDGQPMAENTLQFRWIVTLQGNLAALFAERADVFVAGDLLWYPVEGRPDIRRAPDVLVAIGRPKGDRGAYLQWEEGGHCAASGVRGAVAGEHAERDGAQVRVLRPVRGGGILFDRPGTGGCERMGATGGAAGGDRGHERVGESGVRGAVYGGEGEVRLFYPDGRPFLTFEELAQGKGGGGSARRRRKHRRAQRRKRGQRQRRKRAQQEAEARAARLAERLRALGIELDDQCVICVSSLH
jgi:hypothetical protein